MVIGIGSMATRGLDLNVNASRKTQLIKSLDRLGRRLHNVNYPLVRTNLKLLPSLLINVRPGKHRVPLNASRQRNRTMHL